MKVTLKEILIVRNNSSKRPGCNQEDREARDKKSFKKNFQKERKKKFKNFKQIYNLHQTLKAINIIVVF